jgi:ABC-type transport system substrate-binding protein
MERFEKLHAGRALLFNSVHEDGPISSLQYPDANTVVMKLAFPTHYLLGSLATWLSPPYLMPLEADDKFDIKNDMRGTGPFMLTAYQPDIRRKYERNPNFWDAKYPFVDSVEFINIRENAATIAQFEAGRLWQHSPSNTEALDVKRRVPNVNLHSLWTYGSPGASPLTSGNTNYYMFGDKPGSIFKDLRVRQAVSMLQDRELVVDAVFNVPELEKNGIAMQKAWNGVANAYWGDRMLDPKSNQLGDPSKYWKHDPNEAAKLLRAAGAFGTTQTFTTYISGGGGAGDNFTQITNQMLQDGGHFKINYEAIDLATKFLAGYHFGKGQFDGIAYLTYGSYPEFGHYIWNSWMPSGRNAIRNVEISPKASDLARKHRAEFDAKKRKTIEDDWQREIAAQMPSVPIGGIGTSFQLTQPWLGNGGQVKTYGQITYYEPWTYYHYYDKSKDPKAS